MDKVLLLGLFSYNRRAAQSLRWLLPVNFDRETQDTVFAGKILVALIRLTVLTAHRETVVKVDTCRQTLGPRKSLRQVIAT